MDLRSWLFVPGDSERKLAKAGMNFGADAVVLDLEVFRRPRQSCYGSADGSRVPRRAAP